MVTAAETLTAIKDVRDSVAPLATRRSQIREAHITAVIDAAVLPIAVADVTVAAITQLDINGVPWLRFDGTGGQISWPVIINQPPLLVDDPAGPWTIRGHRTGDGPTVVETVPSGTALPQGATLVHERRFRFAPRAALVALFARLRK